MPKLLLKFNAAILKEIAIDKPALIVGRKPDNDIVIDNPAISGQHCKIFQEGAAYQVEDLNSTNGTFVNEKRVKKTELRHNDVVTLAKHSIVFLDDRPAPAPAAVDGAATAAADKTMKLSTDKLQEMMKASATAPVKLGGLRVLKGVVGQMEYELKGLSTYIGKSDRVQIPIKGSGFFNRAPEVAASIHRKAEGYVLLAVQAGYPVVNGSKVTGQALLNDGDIIECGATTLQFFLR